MGNEPIAAPYPGFPKEGICDNGEGAAQAGQVEGLAWRHEGNGPISHLIAKKSCDGNMVITRIEQIAVNLIGTN
jgi:hypothetical protein